MKKLFLTFVAGMTFVVAPLFAKPYAFPVPFVPSKGNTKITFSDLPGRGSITITNTVGEEVVVLAIPSGVILMDWNVTNSSGKALASGVYFVLVDDGANGKTKFKIVVVR